MSVEPWDLLHYYQARVVDVIDGDTIALDVDLGYGTWNLASKLPGGRRARYPQGVHRLSGISTPQRKTDPHGWAQVRARTLELLALSVEGDTVWIRVVGRDTLGRWEARVWVRTGHGSLEINQQLLDEGLAISRTTP